MIQKLWVDIGLIKFRFEIENCPLCFCCFYAFKILCKTEKTYYNQCQHTKTSNPKKNGKKQSQQKQKIINQKTKPKSTNTTITNKTKKTKTKKNKKSIISELFQLYIFLIVFCRSTEIMVFFVFFGSFGFGLFGSFDFDFFGSFFFWFWFFWFFVQRSRTSEPSFPRTWQRLFPILTFWAL